MSKVLGMLLALALLCALPAMAVAQDDGGDTISSGNTQSGEIEQSASAGSGGNAGNQGAIVQQNAGEDAIAEVNQSQNFRTGGAVTNGRFHGHGHGHGHGGFGGRGVGVSGVGGGVGGGGVGGVTLARTGLDAWVFALIGGGLLAGGLGLLAAQRRGRLNA